MSAHRVRKKECATIRRKSAREQAASSKQRLLSLNRFFFVMRVVPFLENFGG
jgi:hypothetical protein